MRTISGLGCSDFVFEDFLLSLRCVGTVGGPIHAFLSVKWQQKTSRRGPFLLPLDLVGMLDDLEDELDLKPELFF